MTARKRGPGRPWPADHVRVVRVQVTLQPDVLVALDALDALAARWGVTRSAAIARLTADAQAPSSIA